MINRTPLTSIIYYVSQRRNPSLCFGSTQSQAPETGLPRSVFEENLTR